MKYRSFGLFVLGVGMAGCGGVGSGDEQVSLASVGVDVSVTLPTGGTVGQSGLGAAQVQWKGLSWNATFELTTMLKMDNNRPIAQDESGAFEGRTPVTIGGNAYTCWVRAKKEADAKRIQTACDTLAKASPKTPASDSKPAAAKTVELEDRFASAVGCSIKIPKGSKTLMEDKYNTTYSLTLPGGLFEYNVSVNQAGSKSIDDAKRTATMMSGSVQEAKKLDSGMIEVVLAPEGPLQTVSTFLPKHGAKCSGPKQSLPLLLQMCESLTAGDKVAAPGASAPESASPPEPAAPKPAVEAGSKKAAPAAASSAKPAAAKASAAPAAASSAKPAAAKAPAPAPAAAPSAAKK